MATEVILPRIDVDGASGRLARWFAAEGERVREGQPLLEFETEQEAREVEAPASGLLRGVRARSGERLPPGAVVAWIVGEDEAFDPDLQALAGELRALLAPAPATEAPQAPVGLAAPAVASSPASRLHREWLRRGEGAPLVFIHGFGADLNGWRPLAARLPETIGALAIDLPGHGASPLAGEPTLLGIATAVATALTEEGVASAHLVGHSLGGAVAAALAVAPGFRARSLALIAPAGLGPEVNAAFLAGFLRARSAASLAPWLRLLTADPDALGPALLNATLRQRAGDALVEAQTRIAAALFPDGAQTLDIRPWLAALTAPTKVIVGVEDRIIPSRQAERLAGRVALHRFAGVGHMPHLEARRDVARLIEELVKAGG